MVSLLVRRSPRVGSSALARLLLLVFVSNPPVVSASSAIVAKNVVRVDEKLSKSPSLLKILYLPGSGEREMPQCDKWSVCNRVDTYSNPWVERLCTCRNGQQCSTSLQADDGHTVVDRTRQYKVCESVDELPTCQLFKDVTWTHITGTNNKSQQKVHCKCPPNSTAYISGKDVKMTSQGVFLYYYFSCSPESSMKCRRKEPCQLFTVRKRFPVEEVTISTLCQCPAKTYCPSHHTDPYVIANFDSSRPKDGTRTYSGFCGSTES
ncbi:protein giant-lens-like [Uloborus diversus]|uniref:protein giant-lens-like n=1 Tax=Uloborus diversus TaxID=327109 RepID=UPI00240A9C13|nr:protein giant-lens-like [Uloborus diversus]